MKSIKVDVEQSLGQMDKIAETIIIIVCFIGIGIFVIGWGEGYTILAMGGYGALWFAVGWWYRGIHYSIREKLNEKFN